MSLRMLRVLLPLALVHLALSKRVKVGDEVDAVDSFISHNMSKATVCEYIAPENIKTDGGGFPEMVKLMDPAEGGTGLGYVYGPFFKEGTKTSVVSWVKLSECDTREGETVDSFLEPQILALKYDVEGAHVQSYFAKPSCPDYGGTCCNGKGNVPGWASQKAMEPKPDKVYTEDAIVPLGAYGSYKLVKLTGVTDAAGLMYRLEVQPSKPEACYLDHVYVCSKADYIKRCKTASGHPCEC